MKLPKKLRNDKDFKNFVKWLSTLINRHVNIPVIPEVIEQRIFTRVIYFCVKKLIKLFKKKGN